MLRILQNQTHFSDEEYRKRTTSLVEELRRRPLLKRFVAQRHDSFLAGVLMYLCAGDYPVIVTVSHRPSVSFGFMNRLFQRKKTLHVAKEFFLGGEQGSSRIKARIIFFLYRFALRNVHSIIVNARNEIKAYSGYLDIPEERFSFIPWPTNIEDPKRIASHDGSVLAVGRSLRDWKTFFKAVDGTGIRCVVVASRQDIEGLKVPENVELYCDIPREAYIKLLSNAKIVALPLKNTERSTGQASFLEAMAYGKPVVVADVSGAWDYIQDRLNGLLYRPGDVKHLQEVLMELNSDEALYWSVAAKAFEDIGTIFNKSAYAKRMLSEIDAGFSRNFLN